MKISIIGNSNSFNDLDCDIFRIDVPESDLTELQEAINHSNLLFISTDESLNSDGSYSHGTLNRVFKSLSILADEHGVNEQKTHIVICSTVMPGYIQLQIDKLKNINYTITYNPIMTSKFILLHNIFFLLVYKNHF